MSAALAARLKDKARALGFDAAGLTTPDAIPEARDRLEAFIAAGHHGDMAWLARAPERRAAPHVFWPAVRSLLVVGLSYAPARDPLARLGEPARGAISVYAERPDYHEVMKPRLEELGSWLTGEAGGAVLAVVDTAAVMEKPLAQAAGLGWQGKHTNLVSRDHGSWLFLGVLLISLALPPDRPHADHCGRCRRCLDICPTDAFPAPYVLDARRCIAYLTIEHKGAIPRALRPMMGNRIFGCDDCLAVCPWNKFAEAARAVALEPRAALDGPRLGALARLDAAGFGALTRGTPLRRLGRARFLRNVAIALGNAGPGTDHDAIEHLCRDEAAIVRAAAVWALGRTQAPVSLRDRALRAATEESDADVRAEWLRLAQA